jgi:hypothetical protein
MGVFDEGCMGMYNAIIPDELLHPTGVFQGAAEPIGIVRGDARGAGDGGRRGLRLAAQEGHEIHVRARTPKPI